MPDDFWRRTALKPDEEKLTRSSTEELIAEARAGRMFVLVDDERRESHGTLVICAQFASAEIINFMAKFCRGLICLTLTQKRVDELRLPRMNPYNKSPLFRNFTVSIESRNGVTTGISAFDRAHTVATAINAEAAVDDIVTPGHVFPLASKLHGVLERPELTEASIDLARLAGLTPAAVICDIINDSGAMMCGTELVQFCEVHGLKVGTISDLIVYRERSENLIKLSIKSQLTHEIGGIWNARVFSETCNENEHLVLSKGSIKNCSMELVHVHSLTALDMSLPDQAGSPVRNSMQDIADAGNGVLVLIRQSLSGALSSNFIQIAGIKQPRAISQSALARQILRELGLMHCE